MIRYQRSAAVFLVSALCALAGWSVALADCNINPGERAVLFSLSYDPDVFVWDSRQRLIDYSAGSWQTARALLPHALLARAGTKALVLQCQGNVIHPKYRMATQDAVGIKITSGPYRGHYGWVTIDDLRRRH